MATVDPKIASIVAHLPEVKAANRAERDKVAAIARGLFASHNRPGRHEIGTHDDFDAFIDLDGPAPLSVEFGHWTRGHERFIEGLHILSRANAQAAAR